MTAQTDHRTDIADSWAGRVEDMRRMLDDDAFEESDTYALSVEAWTRSGDDEPSRVEMALTLGGPTVIVTYDARGAGWSEYLHSWGMLNGEDRQEWQMTSEEHSLLGDFLRAFYVPELA